MTDQRSVPAATAERPAAEPAPSPLPGYRHGDYFFSSPYRSLLARGTAVASDHAGPVARWSDAASSLLTVARARGIADPVVVGALGFDPATPARLLVPQQVVRGRPPRWLPGVPPPLPGRWRVAHTPPVEEYLAGVEAAVRAIGAGELEKVVLSRALDLTGDGPVPIGSLLRRLADRNACGHVFAADVSDPGEPGTRMLVGASPELLVSRRGSAVVSNPLAGSAPRHPDPVTDRARAAALVASEKDRREHRAVVDDLAARLAPLCADLVVPPEPVLVRTPSMWHLSTRVTGTVRDPETGSLDIAQALHPTPAVGGVPLATATGLIATAEGYDRRYYTGVVGWTDEHGDGEWAIVLRCAEVRGAALRLYAGGGIVAGSEPAAELAETRAKFRTFLAAVGLDAEP
ncbi:MULTISPECIES: isochorismate synthase [Pseudonocardia]|uniref:isochorismate synthase n=2 Tax=Pseudonocardia TaxID=1847 RepID=A0A1Y2MNA6_PSEAH|nr:MULTISPECIES: isochorismate synthase [Pseudonocardia]OSY36736.1 Isochorismate synthase DhbC [Pseudonocardia autotrophica]TDN77149.1 isochorismate synthase [Pseudonocardia autotrophica]BBG01154.1 isochorismate synthase DhbC [Pseudonocardia autotrophica]GEC26790.1 isochorismate synthase DhbC [Pseudonocardia saturnea]